MEELQNVSSDARNRIGGRRVNNSATSVLRKTVARVAGRYRNVTFRSGECLLGVVLEG